jgi:hypothetical protein
MTFLLDEGRRLARQVFDVALRWPARSLLRQAAHLLGNDRAFVSADRRLLEDRILPHFAAAPRTLSVLFVGTHWYTRRCEQIFAGHRYRTIDIDPRAARHGSAQGHVTASAAEVASHYLAGSFDLVVVNGVFGWGLNERTQVEAAARGFFEVLRNGGDLVVGWNDIVGRRPHPVGPTLETTGFIRAVFEPLGAQVVDVPGSNHHRFEFFRKPL